MALRTIMIFPEFENMELIQAIRKSYDPLYALVRPHITLVFPFEDDLSNQELQNGITEALGNFQPFPLVLQGISRESSPFGNYIFLNVAEGSKPLCRLHRALYQTLWDTNVLDYTPHMTVGKLDTADEMERAYSALEGFSQQFETLVHTVSVEMIGEHDESIILMEVKL